ncbi:MAG: methionine--tRNA ligase [Candidatus Anstonellales archaeon]
MRVLITAALPYANGPIHLGHIRSTYLPADIYARFNRLIGNDTLYICAMDEHGTPIVVAAEKEGKNPKEFVDYYYKKDKEEFSKLGFSFDIFHRTSSEENREFTQMFFEKLKENGYIYEKEVSSPYCERCRRYLPDRFVIGTCPSCSADEQYSDYCEVCGKALQGGEIINPRCIVCKEKPVGRVANHYFFSLSSFSDKLEKWLAENTNLQKEVVNYLLGWIEKGLSDWDITRDLEWGVPIPGKDNCVFYVWFDAPIGYVSSTKACTNEWEKYWKEEGSEIVHFIGKDIAYHHFLFWVAMLMGINDGFRLPDKIPVRGYLNLEGKKFSKSKGWFVSLGCYLENFEPDYLRYYETAITPHSVVDADFVWKEFQSKINNELVASLGNFVHRTLSLIKKLNGCEVPQPIDLDEKDKDMLMKITKAKENIRKLISEFNFKEGQEMMMALSDNFNRYLSEREPWKDRDERRRKNCLYVCMRGISALAILMQPFLPFSSQKLCQMCGIEKKEVRWENIDAELIKPHTRIENFEPLFKKIEDEKIKKMESMLYGGGEGAD